jgi:hypothetical protein
VSAFIQTAYAGPVKLHSSHQGSHFIENWSLTMVETYAHRKNADGTWDAICKTCYLTAAKASSEPELREIEPLHKCKGSVHEMATRLTNLLLVDARMSGAVR